MHEGWSFVDHTDLCLSDYYVNKIHLPYSGYVKFLSDFQTIFSPEPVEKGVAFWAGHHLVLR